MQQINLDKLTPREREIVDYLTTGESCKMIAEKLFISIETVKSHCKNIYRKLKVKGKVELIIALSKAI